MGAFPSYGYIKNPEDNHKLIIDKESAEIVRKIFEWKVNEGLGNLSICHRLNDMGVLNPTGYKKKRLNQNYNNVQIMQEDYSWCPSTVRNILKNDIYIGNITQGKRRVKSYKVHKVEQVPEQCIKNTVKIKVVLFMNITYVEHIEKSPINYAQSIL